MKYRRRFSAIAATFSLVIVTSTTSLLSANEQVQENIDTLIRENGCPGCNLQGADLNRMDLSGADLSEANLIGASFFLTDLSAANLSGADLREGRFGGADLANANLSGADLRDAVLDGAYLKGSVMDGSIIEVEEEPEEVRSTISEDVEAVDMIKPKEIKDQKKVAFEEESLTQEPPPVKNVTPIEQISIKEGEQKKNDATVVDNGDDSAIEPVLVVEEEAGADQADVASTETPLPEEVIEANEVTEVEEAEGEEAVETPTIAVVEAVPDSSTPLREGSAVEPVPASLSSESANTNFDQADETTAEVAAAVVDNVEVDPQVAILIEKLLDRKRCYGCDLQGADLSRKKLRKSDLERSMLDGANLEGIDLEMANLKGVSFKGANLRDADLRKADLYKADFSGADMTGADLGEALIDEAIFSDVIGYQPSLITP